MSTLIIGTALYLIVVLVVCSIAVEDDNSMKIEEMINLEKAKTEEKLNKFY